MLNRKRTQKWLILAMAGMLIFAAIFWVYAVSGFSLSYAACDGTFALDSKLARCGRPVVFLWLFWVCFAAGISCGLAALARALLARRKQHQN
ncbi:hypothetical protein [Dyella kyungheensis]|uniref:Transmembrane protein n=1 Tax=Dyella kyungheensis TaxID=1242174 RepID=A0ABS2JXI0_9GAMM|nr:hypothetical protein [Dyella kyungheensis]MBM7123727.1 hypothetical protein [Dyella kyungheensis]